MSRCFVAAALIVLASASAALAQQGGSAIRGQIIDQQKGGLPGAAIVVTHAESGVSRETTSGADGNFSVSAIVPGPYLVNASLAGFRKMTREVRVEIGKTLTLELVLPLESITQEVVVTGQAPQVDLTSSQNGGTVGQAELNTVPTVSRGFGGLVALLPGVAYTPSSSPNDSFTINGSQSTQVLFVLDGGINSDDRNGGSTSAQARASLEAIQEFQVVSSQFDAEYGRMSGGIVNAVTKQGTNQFRGSMFGYFNSENMTAQDYFAAQRNLPKPEAGKQQYGVTFGGPIIRDRTHFFGSFERILINQGISHTFQTRPELDYSSVIRYNYYNTIARLDHQLSSNHTFNFRFVRDYQPNYDQVGETQTLAGIQHEFDFDTTMQGTLTSVIGQNRVNVLRMGRTRENNNRGAPDFLEGPNQDRQDLITPGLLYLTYTDGYPDTMAQRRWQTSYQLEDQLSWFIPGKRGEHDLKVGVSYIYASHRQFRAETQHGVFRFATDRPFNAADAATYPERLSVRVPGAQRLFPHTHSGAVFAQDKWRLNKRVTLNLGLRYDIDIAPIDEGSNPFFPDEGDYPIDTNNIQPRVGVAISPNDRIVIRAGYGRFFERVLFNNTEDYMRQGVFSDSFVTNFPINGVDPGPSRGQFPTDPLLVNGPVVNRTLLERLFPEGTIGRNIGAVVLDTPERENQYTDSISVGYEQQLRANLSVAADYIHREARKLTVNYDLNPGLKTTTSRTAPVNRTDTLGLASQMGLLPFASSVTIREHNGSNRYDGVNLSIDKRFASSWSGRASYSYGNGRGNSVGGTGGAANPFQVGAERNLDLLWAPLAGDRTHIASFAGVVEVPKTHGLRAKRGLSDHVGNTVHNLRFDRRCEHERAHARPLGRRHVFRTGTDAITVENEGGVNGARGPGYRTIDMRGGYVIRLRNRRTLDLFVESFNLANDPNFANPSGDRRLSSFLLLQSLTGGGFPRALQVGARLGF